MSKCLRCGAGSEWIQGKVPDEPKHESAAPKGSAKWSNEDLQWLVGEIGRHTAIKESDNRKILWLAMNTKAWLNVDLGSVEADILGEIENRLYPEFDGETVTFEKWGWKTPEGEIRYLPKHQAQPR